MTRLRTGSSTAPSASISARSRRVFACTPEADPARASVELVVEHVARVGVVGLDDEQPRVAELQELAFEVAAAEVDVGEATAVDVVTFDVVLQLHHLAEQPARRVRRRFGP